LKTTVAAVFIADEESGSDPDVGVDHLCRDGKLNFLKSGPLYWVDSADLHPLVGSGTMIPWKLTFLGKRGHSGLPHNAINPILIAIEALRYILSQFHRDFPTHPVHVLHTHILFSLLLSLFPSL
jgi:acetylornithine deacetylase